jgi:Secretion system C-terminal sorting domain
MKKQLYNCLLLIGILMPNLIFSQDYYDRNWIVSNKRVKSGEWKSVKLTFISDTILADSIKLPYASSTAPNGCISNKNGVFQYSSNGCIVASKDSGVKIYNSDSLGYPGIQWEFSCASGELWMHQGIMSIPFPEKEDLYLMFHFRYSMYTGDTPSFRLFTLIDMVANNGAGKVLIKNQEMIEGAYEDQITAVRHGNGRDWWIVTTKLDSDHTTVYLLTDKGVSAPIDRYMGLTWHSLNGKSVIGRCAFSPNGRWFCRVGYGNNPQLFHFDRCTGEFYCPTEIHVKKAIETTFRQEWDPHPLNKTVGSMSFSPNSQYFYVDNNFQLFQYDLSAPIIEDSWDLVGEYDGNKDPFPNTLYQLQIAPNGKIYMSASNGMPSLHTIHFPNKKGKACGFKNHDFPLFFSNGFCLPNMPNYHLYDFEDSPCDTLGIDAPTDSLKNVYLKSGDLLISPNPASEKTFISVEKACSAGNVIVYSVEGRKLAEINGIIEGNRYELDLSSFAQGVYFVSLYNNCDVKVTKKLVIIRK